MNWDKLGWDLGNKERGGGHENWDCVRRVREERKRFISLRPIP